MSSNDATPSGPKTADNRPQPLQRGGTASIVAGAIGMVLVTITAELWRLVQGGPMPYEIVLVLVIASAGGIGFGLLERIDRPTRIAVARLLQQREDDSVRMNAIETRLSIILVTTSKLDEMDEILRTIKPDHENQLRVEKAQSWYSGYAKGNTDERKATGTHGGSTGEVRRLRPHQG